MAIEEVRTAERVLGNNLAIGPVEVIVGRSLIVALVVGIPDVGTGNEASRRSSLFGVLRFAYHLGETVEITT